MTDIEILQQQMEAAQKAITVLSSSVRILLRKIPFIFRQRPTDVGDGEFNLEIPISYDISDGVVYFVPSEASIDGANTLIISHAGINYEYQLVKELLNGTLTNVGVSDISPNRLCMLRLDKRDNGTLYAIVVNHSFDTYAHLGSLEVNGTATFKTLPTVFVNGVEYQMISKLEYDALAARVLAIEQSKVIGTSEPSVALDGKPDGTIYFRVVEQ